MALFNKVMMLPWHKKDVTVPNEAMLNKPHCPGHSAVEMYMQRFTRKSK